MAADAPPVALYVGYYASQRQGDTIHSPQNCLPGAGWRPVSAERTTVDLGGRTIPVNRFIIQKGLDRQAVFYWYQGRSRVVANEFANKAWLMLDAARLRRTDGGLVRAITPVASTPDAAFATLTTFSTALFPHLSSRLP
jgi:EpsI family protein